MSGNSNPYSNLRQFSSVVYNAANDIALTVFDQCVGAYKKNVIKIKPISQNVATAMFTWLEVTVFKKIETYDM
jgi:hypothetical protein